MDKKLLHFENKIGYSFKNKNLLYQALTHSSYAYENQTENISDNEVLEFLGDSVLGLIIADFLCTNFPELSEGELSKLKSAAASTSSLSYFANKIQLEKIILLGKGERKNDGRKKKRILAGAFEALIAAIYLDGGFDETRDFLIGHLKPFFKKFHIKDFHINNYKSALQEYLQKANLPAPIYKTIMTKGPDHKKSFFVQVVSQDQSLGKAKGHSKKDAEQKAAKKALKRILGKKIKSLSSEVFLFKKKHD